MIERHSGKVEGGKLVSLLFLDARERVIMRAHRGEGGKGVTGN